MASGTWCNISILITFSSKHWIRNYRSIFSFFKKSISIQFIGCNVDDSSFTSFIGFFISMLVFVGVLKIHDRLFKNSIVWLVLLAFASEMLSEVLAT